MCISELISLLESYKTELGDTEIAVTWEGCIRTISQDNIYPSRFGALLIDADNNRYMEDFKRL
jgi:hypothetical protein